MISVSFVSVLLPLHTLVTTMCGVASKTYRLGLRRLGGHNFVSIISYIGHRAQCGHNTSVQAKREHNNLL